MRVYQPTWQKVEGELLAVNDNSVTSVGSTVEAAHDVIATGENVNVH